MGEEERENTCAFQSFEGDAIIIVVHIEGKSSVGLVTCLKLQIFI